MARKTDRSVNTTKLSVGTITTPVTTKAAITAPTGGATTDAEARTAINSIITVLEQFGLVAAN
jgi:hypothetical protein